MKKLIALLLALVMVIGLVACGEPATPDTPDEPDTQGNVQEPDQTEGQEPPVEAAKKTIYVLVPNPDHGWTGAIGVAAQEKFITEAATRAQMIAQKYAENKA